MKTTIYKALLTYGDGLAMLGRMSTKYGLLGAEIHLESRNGARSAQDISLANRTAV